MMYRRVALIFGLFILFYVGIVQFQVMVGKKSDATKTESGPEEEKPAHKVYVFSFTKYTPEGNKEIEIEGDSADIFARTVNLLNVVAKAYAQEVPVTITADKGSYDKAKNKVHLNHNVIATTEDGTRLLTEELDIHPSDSLMQTEVQAEVKKDNINIEGEGAEGDSKLKQVKFKKNVTVVIKDDGENSDERGPTIITCDGPLDVDYERNIAYFQNNVVAEDDRGRLTADRMDVYYSKMNKRVAKIIAMGNVIIENPDGNTTYSDNVIYLAEEGRIILGGDTEALYYGGESESMEWSEVFE